MGFPSSTRLRREDCRRTKHDSAFSQWEILIGPFDWQNYSLGKDGIEKYRIHNIPSSCSCPGLYELGVAAVCTDLGRDVRKLDSDRVVVVYLGQADNIRTRLQHYGRAGSHLDYGKAFYDLSGDYSSKGPGLFREIFSRGYPIVFRWASMENKKTAERTEAQLLSVFDYAWNKGGNGERRPNDVYQKLDKIVSRTPPNITKKIHKWFENHVLPRNKKGVKIKATPLSVKEVKARPALITVKQELNGDNRITCGLSLGDGSVCTRSPVKGRKRCEEHKGKRNIGTSSRSVKQEKFYDCAGSIKDEPVEVSMHEWMTLEAHEGNSASPSRHPGGNISGSVKQEKFHECAVPIKDEPVEIEISMHEGKTLQEGKGVRPSQHPDGNLSRSVKQEKFLECAVAIKTESVEVPMQAGKSCGLYEGKDVNLSKNLEGNLLHMELNAVRGVVSDDQTIYDDSPIKERKNYGKHKGNLTVSVCGVHLGDGEVCREVPVYGRKRCAIHKGRRVTP